MKIKKNFIKFAMILVPIYTISLALNASIFEYNLSIVGNYFNMRISFILWGAITGLFLMIFINDLFKKTNFTDKKAIVLLYSACILFISATLIPYLPDIMPKTSSLHELFAFISPFILLSSIYIFVSQLIKTNSNQFKKSMFNLKLIVISSFILLLIFGFVTSVLEIFVLISTIFFLKDLEKKINKI